MPLASQLSMMRFLRFLGISVAVLLVAAHVEAASVTLAWNANTEPDISGYHVGWRTSPTGNETVEAVGNVTTWTFTATPAITATYYFRIFAQNTAGQRSPPSNEVSTTITGVGTNPPPSGGGLTLERGGLNFGAVQSSGTTLGPKTPGQRVMVTQTAGGALIAWSASAIGGHVTVSPASGSGTGPITVSLASTALGVGTYTDTVRVTVGATQLNIPVTTRVYSPGASTAPAGFFDTPTNGITNVAGSLPVTGWAVDDVNIVRVDILRDSVGAEPAGMQILLGSASLVAGSRPDVENAYPTTPMSYRAGWGFMVLTNMLPDLVNGRANGGNGQFRLHAYAVDAEGASSYLGAKLFTANNAASVKPFGTLDTPTQGGTASGTAFAVWGWAISPTGNIANNGSTITVFVDGVSRGNPTYNISRPDIAGLFPGYADTNGAVGVLTLNTTTLTNGVHTISWVVTDNLGNTEGIGSRFFNVQNGSSALTSAGAVQSSMLARASQGEAMGQTVETVSEVPTENATVEVKKVESDDATPALIFPEWSGEIQVQTREAEQVEVRLANRFDNSHATYEGYVVASGRMRPLPVGASLNKITGVFTWQPGPGFLGRYQFVFIRTTADGFKTRVPVDLTISPKHDGEDR